ncbi:uncharacterized protein BP01DRAFT_90050 [Aspergillus saccharolyticus JOP 1030-1]|uniref:Uncharacterized protein n=1 Tax=Aspergillus saccharolyticus JOP 1030-1 TaxID=1450539 RepID=A0A318ZUV1_9EURO|nr:hypothetical protein BP01DRAFT_90050 [Aspergillus saccharolyticus JOP 1030-1]PYH43878.1 hypothetical protein BP01DRAFT_90050 [Aspergillus saccharolyticus JOP 1030-1]
MMRRKIAFIHSLFLGKISSNVQGSGDRLKFHPSSDYHISKISSDLSSGLCLLPSLPLFFFFILFFFSPAS